MSHFSKWLQLGSQNKIILTVEMSLEFSKHDCASQLKYTPLALKVVPTLFFSTFLFALIYVIAEMACNHINKGGFFNPRPRIFGY